MTLYSRVRYNSFDHYRPPLAFGVTWDTTSSSPTLTRVGDAADMSVEYVADDATYGHYDSDFDDYLPWSGMGRVEVTTAGDIRGKHGETDLNGTSTFDETYGGTGTTLIYVSIPKFWYRVDYSTLTPSTVTYWISPYPLAGYQLHPAFQRSRTYGNAYGVVEYVYVGAYEGYKPGTGLLSVVDQTPTVSLTRAQFRTAANAVGGTLLDYTTWSAIQLLYLVEYASLDSQTALAEGITHAPNVIGTGFTSNATPGGYDLGNTSGKVKVGCSHWNTSGTNDWAMSYRGIENLWGNTWTILDGINIDITKEIYIAGNSISFADKAAGVATMAVSPYSDARILAPAADGYIKAPATFEPDAGARWSFFPGTVTGGSSSTYMCDYYITAASWAVPNYPVVGGNYNITSLAGIFEMVTVPYTLTDAALNARLMMVQHDNTGYYIY
jgi:hypothetical protein